jgi:hypothetical protein
MEAKYLNAAGLITTGAGFLDKLNIGTSVANSTITLYDNTTNSGKKLAVVSTAGAPTPTVDFGRVRFVNGLYADVSTGNPDFTVSFE